MYKIQNTKKSGQAVLVAVVFFTSISLLLIANGVNRVTVEARRARDLSDSSRSFYLAEAGAEEAGLRIKKGWSDVTSLTLDGFNTAISVSTSGGAKTISSTANVNNAIRKTSAALVQGVGSDFSYGAQIGSGGLDMGSNSKIKGTGGAVGNVYTNGSITGASGSEITGVAYAVGTISNPPLVNGGIGGRFPGSSPQSMPAFDIEYWKNQAAAGNTLNGDQNFSGGVNPLGPTKVVGNVELVNSNAKVQIRGPVYITENLTLKNGSEISVDPSGTVILVEGKILFKEGSKTFATVTNPKGYLLFVSLSTNNNDSDPAINIENNADIKSVVYALNGKLVLGNAKVTAVLGNAVKLMNTAEIIYEQGLANSNFTSGPSGGWNIASWQEI